MAVACFSFFKDSTQCCCCCCCCGGGCLFFVRFFIVVCFLRRQSSSSSSLGKLYPAPVCQVYLVGLEWAPTSFLPPSLPPPTRLTATASPPPPPPADLPAYIPTSLRFAGVLFWTRKEQVQCAVSTTTVVGFAYLLVAVCFDYDWAAIVVRHVVPLLIMNYWLVMVTYLQHHEADTNVRYVFFPSNCVCCVFSVFYLTKTMALRGDHIK